MVKAEITCGVDKRMSLDPSDWAPLSNLLPFSGSAVSAEIPTPKRQDFTPHVDATKNPVQTALIE